MSHQLPHLEEIAADVVKAALAAGATGAEASVSEGDEFSADVRMGEVEQVKESGSRGLGVRVLVGAHTGSSYTSDFTPAGLRELVSRAMDLARITTADPFAGLPDPAELGALEEGLGLYSADVAELDPAARVDMARRAEKAAREFDPRITNSEGANFGARAARHAFANSLGFTGSYRTSSCSLHAVPVAKSGERMERDYWYSISRSAAGLMSPEELGHKAARRVLRRLDARKVPTRRVPVVFEPRAARTLVGHVFEAVSGEAVYRNSSFLAGLLGERIAGESISLFDDATIPGLFGSYPFDDEGCRPRRTAVIEGGVLRSFLNNSYTGRKLGLRTSGSASRGITGNASVGHGNLYFPSGDASPDDLIRRAGTGLFVTDLMGFGFNPVTGDYSRGAGGLWIENGELTHAVSEVTIAGNLKDMLLGMILANDLEFQGAVASPTVLIPELTISGS